jgi:hypothetical protein
MNPQIVVMDQGGVHNADPAALARVKDSGNWKSQRIITLIPAAESIPTKVALSIWNLIYPPNNGQFKMAAIGLEVGVAYSQSIQWILAHPDLTKWEYLLTIEHDNMPPVDGVLKLLESMDQHPEYTALSGLYWTKGEGGVPQIWGDITDPVVNYRPQPPKPDTLHECYGLGMGFCLWQLQKLKDPKLPNPLFRTKASAAEGVGTQDLTFWSEARKHGHRCAVDTRVKVGHYDLARDLVW